MTKKQKKYTVSTFVILLFAALFVIGIFYVGDVSSQSQNAGDAKIQQQTKLPDKTKKISDPIWKSKVPTKQLVKESRLIVVGKPVNNLCVASADASEVVTEYKFKTEEIIKGAAQAGDVITIRLPGGLIRQTDGSTFNVFSAGFKKMRNNFTYLLFLDENGSQQFSSRRGPQGIFEFTDNSAILVSYGAFANENFRPGTNVENFNAAQFLGEIRKLVKQKDKK